MMRVFLIVFLFMAGATASVAQKEIVVDNIKPRLDTEGNIIDAHDGRIVQYGNRFYWYGTAYGNTSGYQRSNFFQCYSSPDFKTWKKEGALLIDPPSGIYYRPHVIYNQKTRKYVLWYNWYPYLWEGRYGVAVSDHPAGPFKIMNSNVKVKNAGMKLGDFGLFVDDDQAAYLAYNTIDGHKGSIEKLSADYLSSTLENGGIITEGCEAGAIFKRKGVYYLLTDQTCCFCTQGTGVRVYTSDHPMRGYVLRNNINRFPGRPAPALMNAVTAPNVYETLRKNSNGSFDAVDVQVAGDHKSNAFKIYQFTGNRAGVCGDTLVSKGNEERLVAAFDLMVQQEGKWVKIPSRRSVITHPLYNIITLVSDSAIGSAVRLQPAHDYPYTEMHIGKISVFDGDAKKAEHKPVTAFVVSGHQQDMLPIIPAQQTFVMPLVTSSGVQFIWMADIWGSAPDNVKGHDLQYWGAPLVFDANGDIQTMRWVDEWKVELRN